LISRENNHVKISFTFRENLSSELEPTLETLASTHAIMIDYQLALKQFYVSTQMKVKLKSFDFRETRETKKCSS